MKGTDGTETGAAVLIGARPRRARLRVVLAVLGGVVALLCLGGAGVALVLYDEATKIDRGSPAVAVDNYLRAYLIQRDDAQAALYACEGASVLPQLQALRSDVESREKSQTMSVNFSWSSLAVTMNGERATVRTSIERAVSDGLEQIADPWSFDVADQDGWRVCGATKGG